MKKTLTMQDLLKDLQLLNILSSFREEDEIKEFLNGNNMEVDSTTLFSLKKSLESQTEQFEKTNAVLSEKDLKGVAGGGSDDTYWDCIAGGHTALDKWAWGISSAAELITQGWMAYAPFREMRKAAKAGASAANEAEMTSPLNW